MCMFISETWKKNYVVSIFKDKGGVQKYGNYGGIKLMSQNMKI